VFLNGLKLRLGTKSKLLNC